jgi:hypothetical protein
MPYTCIGCTLPLITNPDSGFPLRHECLAKCVHVLKDNTCGFMNDSETEKPCSCTGFDFKCIGYRREDDE